MPGIEWTDKEKAFAVHLASAGIIHNTITTLITKRGPQQRSKSGVDYAIGRLKDEHLTLRSPHQWNCGYAAEWVRSLISDAGIHPGFLKLTDEENSIIKQAQPKLTLPHYYLQANTYTEPPACPEPAEDSLFE
ncbi:uncharacterized protein BDCG_07537 [Blastomyces dermatitidis ER-3]|uniref:Uncharacterized protein n=3 Tax=Blastomyces TaxID=229219 RepID=A0A179UH97_BLAGS|nr:uncharacterized protein BDBG_03222 [Blastomyces gilchristii SLH14081]XP_045278744.1 uncharacterized protein BDCG_07537 [Blastomyces dermatitidis ER-3]EEQ92417.1 hypothetical protein BDCG_07537 [Blastomyces dermatitidis ER-3]EGE84049.2 hypothetical protein BDDG_06994 [Blastomyces dermatitidis ATCC 18188]OAT07123.1 hypothetical protein BDBG_03222 [Blastomyces gilchristii SLH14081]